MNPVQASNSQFSIGVRGGGQTWLPTAITGANGTIQPGIGGTGTLDLRYTFYGCFNDLIGMGFTLGGGVGYGTSSLNVTNTDIYSNTDYLGNQLDYTIYSNFKQTDQFAKGEVSLMLAFCFGPVIVNVGPRFMMPFAAKSTLNVSDAQIDAYYPRYDVHVINQPITGYLPTPYAQKATSLLPKYNVLIAAEIGYEWFFDESNSVGVQLYADYGAWNSGLANTPIPNALIDVSPISDAANPVPTVIVNDPQSMVANKRYLDFGLRVYYGFSGSGKEKNNHHYNYHKDTRKHRNRYLWR